MPSAPPPPEAAVRAPERIALRTLRAPDSWPAVSAQAWQVAPGATFAAGTVLGEITFPLPPAGGFSAALRRWLRRQPPQLRTYAVCAPEDGVLTWHAAATAPIRVGEPLAAYIPLAAWQEYQQLLSEHERQVRQYAAALQQTAAGLSGQLEAMIAWVAALHPQTVRTDRSGLLPLLARHLRQTLRAACPVPPAELAPLYHRYFCLIQTLDERFRFFDTRYADLLRAALTPEQEAELLRRWNASKAAAVRQILGGEPEAMADG